MRMVCGFRVDTGPHRRGHADRLRRHVLQRAARLARDRGLRLGDDAGRWRRRAADQGHLGPADRLPDEPADPGAGRHVGLDRRHAGRTDAPAVRHRRTRRRCPGRARSASVAHATGRGSAPRGTRPGAPPPTAVPATAAGRPRWRDQRRPALDLPHRRPLAAGPARLDPDRRRAGRRPRPDARPRQDADGRLPRRHARDAAPRRGARAVGDVLAHARHPRPRRRWSSAPEGFLPPDLVVKSAPVVAAISIVAIGGWMLISEGRRRWRIRAPAIARRAHAHGARARPRARRTTTSTSTTTHDAPARPRRAPGEHSHGGVAPQPPPAGRNDDLVAQPVRPRACRRPDPVDQRAADPARLDRRRAARLRVRPGRRLRARDGAGHGRDRAGARARPRPARSRRRRLAARPVRAASSRSRLPVLVFGLGIYLTIQAVAGNTTLLTPAAPCGTATRANSPDCHGDTLC